MRPRHQAFLPSFAYAVLAFGAAVSALVGPGPCRAADRENTWGGNARVERFHTSDLFPGAGEPRPDWGLRASLKAEAGFPVGSRLRILEWAKLVAERYDVWSPRDLEQWSLGTDFRGQGYRFRIYGELTKGELAFPAANSDGAILDRSALGSDLRVDLGPGWRADLKAEYERQNYVPSYDERDGNRWTLRTGVERNLTRGRSLGLFHEYRRARSVTQLFSFEQNSLRGVVDWPLPLGVSGELELQLGLRNYRTGQSFATNFGRSDHRSVLSGTLERGLAGPLRAHLFGSWKHRTSTRASKDYDVSTVGIALSANR